MISIIIQRNDLTKHIDASNYNMEQILKTILFYRQAGYKAKLEGKLNGSN